MVRIHSNAFETGQQMQGNSETTVVEQTREAQVQAEVASQIDAELSKESAKQMTDSMNRFLETVDTQLKFKFHDQLNEYYVTIVDSKTDKVVREIPSKKLMDIHAAMREFIGLLVDHKI